MASKGVSALKFVGTVSLGLLTGFGYTLTTLTLPTILSLPSAPAASRAYASVRLRARRTLRGLTAVASSAFLLAFLLSPRRARHPYLAYTAVLAAASALSDRLVPVLARSGLLSPPPPSPRRKPSPPTAAAAPTTSRTTTTTPRPRATMEASYDVLGDLHSEGSAASVSGGEDPDQDEDLSATLHLSEHQVNGEDVRDEVESFARSAVVRTALSSLAFFLAVVGIWGDGVVPVYNETVVYI